MRIRSRIACISAAVAALMCGSRNVWATDLTWDIDPGTAGVQDGDGSWDTVTSNWYDSAIPTNVTWSNATPDSALLGNATTASAVGIPTPHNIFVIEPITVQNLLLGTAQDGQPYNLLDGGGSLTVNGNVVKVGPGGAPTFFNSQITLAAGDHTFALRDTSGNTAEMVVNSDLTGAGGVILDNAATVTHGLVTYGPYETWGTLAFNIDNTYTGATTISNGRLVITTAGALGATSTGTTISNAGTLSIGGGGFAPAGGLTITEPLTITRNTYTGGLPSDSGAFERYPAAIIVNNNGTAQTHTITGPLVIDSTDARIQVNTNTLVISSNITEGGTVTPGTGQLTLDGDFAGFVRLTADNSAGPLASKGVKLIGGVQLDVANHNEIGGATAPITFAGSATFHPMAGFMTTFGTHPINQTTFSGGLDVDEFQTFTVDIPLGDTVTAVGSIGKRGKGTLNLNASINLRGGSTYWDRGVVNVNSDVTLQSLHLRSPEVNIPTGGVVTATSANSIFGESSTGTDGGPDKATVNINGGQLIVNGISGTNDFYLSDAATTEGTINLNSGVLTVNGPRMHLGRNNTTGGIGKIVQNGGTFTLTRTADFTLVLGSRAGTGTYEMNGGTMTCAGEFYVGQGVNSTTTGGTGNFTMTGGAVNVNSSFVVGREGGKGTVDISGGILTKAGTFNTSIDDGVGIGPSSMIIRGTGEYRANTGDFRVGVNTGGNATLTMQNSAKLTVSAGELWAGNNGGTGAITVTDSGSISVNNNWIAIGRRQSTNGSNGTLTLQGNATVTKAGGGNFVIADGSSSTGTVTLSDNASIVNNNEFMIGNGGGTATLTMSGNSSITTGSWVQVGRLGGAGTLNISSGTFTRTATNLGNNNYVAENANQTSVINLSGTGVMTINGGQFWLGNASTSKGTLNISGNSVFSVTTGTANNNAGSNWIAVGRNGTAQGVLNLSENGTLNSSATYDLAANTGTNFVIGSGGGSGTFTQTGGTLNAQSMAIGESGAGTGVYTINNGNSNILTNLAVGLDGSNGTFNISGTANVVTGPIEIGHRFTSHGTINLDGGTLTAASVNGGASTGVTKVFNFNGGTLKASTSTATFMQGLSAANVQNGGAFINSNGFNVTMAQPLVAVGTGGLTKSGAGTLEVPYVRLPGLTVNGGILKITTNGGPTGASKVGALAVTNAGTQLDLNDNDMVVDNTPVSAVRSLIFSGYAGGAWTGDGIITTGIPPAGKTAGLGYAQGSDAALAIPDLSGQTFAGVDSLVKYTYFGDSDLDGDVDGVDVGQWSGNFTGAGGSSTKLWTEGDWDYDGDVDGVDVGLWSGNFTGSGGGVLSPPAGVAAVPEPASIGLFGIAAAGLIGRRQRRR
jgi:fibronectin-binding autotransporter adhesin